MDKSPLSYSRRAEEPEFNLREWALKANGISRQTTNSRRLSASNIRSFREDAAKSFRSTITTISSTASSPGYPLIRDEIDPSTYSFTTALKALQARSLGCGWECLSPEGFALNSKWNEAEKYICNPLSGEVPVQCLSAKTLSGRSFRKLTGRVTMSAPLAYSNRSPKVPTDPYYCATAFHEDDDGGEVPFPSTRAKMERMTRDVGTQSTPPDMSSSSSSSSGPAPPTPTIFEERSLKPCEAAGGSLPHSNAVSLNSDKQCVFSDYGSEVDSFLAANCNIGKNGNICAKYQSYVTCEDLPAEGFL